MSLVSVAEYLDTGMAAGATGAQHHDGSISMGAGSHWGADAGRHSAAEI